MPGYTPLRAAAIHPTGVETLDCRSVMPNVMNSVQFRSNPRFARSLPMWHYGGQKPDELYANV
jgi:hypothetical protein